MTERDRKLAEQVAVALHYDPAKDAVPRLTAKGRGQVAEKIVEIAEASGVHIEHNRPLANALSRLDFGQQIPRELYRAVAEVIGFVLNKAGQMPKTGENVSEAAAGGDKPAPVQEEDRKDGQTL
jgi:flagellar biosynthesis protein